MKWSERLKWIAGWDLFLQAVVLMALVALGISVLATDRCSGAEANAEPVLRVPPAAAPGAGSNLGS